MKKSLKLLGIIALMAVIGFSMTGCPIDADPDPGTINGPAPGEPGVLHNVDIRGARALMIAPRGTLMGATSRARIGIQTRNGAEGDLALYMEVGQGEWVEVSMRDGEGTELDLGAPVDLMALTSDWVVMRWTNGDEHLVSTSTGAVFDATGLGLMSSQDFPDYLPFDTDHSNPREFNQATATTGPNPVHSLFPGQSKVHTVSADRVFALVRDGGFWRIADINMTGGVARRTMISLAGYNVRQFAVDSNNNILFDVGTHFMVRMFAPGGYGMEIPSAGSQFPAAPAGNRNEYRRGAIPTIFSVDGQIYFLVREVFREADSQAEGTINVNGIDFDYWSRQIRAYRARVVTHVMQFDPITYVDGLERVSTLSRGLFARAPMGLPISPFSEEVVFDLATNAAFHSLPLNGNGYDVRFDLATNSAFQSQPIGNGGPTALVNLSTNSAFQNLSLNYELSWGDEFADGLRIHADNVTAVSGPGTQARALRVPTDATWGQGVYLLNEFFNFQPGDSIFVSGTVENLGPYTGETGLIMLNAAPGGWQPIAVEYQIENGPFTLSATLQDWHMSYIRYTGREHGGPGIRIEIRSDTATTTIHNIRIERPGTAAGDIFADIPLSPVGGHHTVVAGPSTQARALRITTDQHWGQGIDIDQSDFRLQAGDRVVVTGFLETLGYNEGYYWANPLVQLNANPGGVERVVGTAHSTLGAFTLGAVLDQGDVDAIASALARYANPAPNVFGGLGLRIEFRRTGTVGRIDNIQIERPTVDIFANIPLAHGGGNITLVQGQTAHTRAIQITTTAAYGQGIDIHRDLSLQAGYMVTVTGRVTLGTNPNQAEYWNDPLVFLNANPLRGWAQVGNVRDTNGNFEISGQLTQEQVNHINAPRDFPWGLRIDFRGTGTVGVIYNVRITRGGDPGPGPQVVVTSPSFTGGIDRMFHFSNPSKTVILERGQGWETSDLFVISTWPATGSPSVSDGNTGGIMHDQVNRALGEHGQGIMIAGRTSIYLRAQNRVIRIDPDTGNAEDALTSENNRGITTVLHHEVTGNDTVLVDGTDDFGDRLLIEIFGPRSRILRHMPLEEETITLVRLF